ncbi:MAG: rhomboid family intramembrane serine protease, partial [Planctomycetes bacterium]|nr:rhomboid family intramembrane serine protease [Planctomycetota bacterium]
MLYQWGNELEREMGRARYLVLYFGSAAYGAMMHAAYQYVALSAAPAISFFGPVFAVMAAYAWRYPSRTLLFFFVIPMRLRTGVLLTGAVALFYCLVYLHAGLSPVAFLAAGLVALAFHYAEPALDRWVEGLEARRQRAVAVEGVELRHDVDAILEKISREGLGSLSRRERKLLKRASESMGRDRGRSYDG